MSWRKARESKSAHVNHANANATVLGYRAAAMPGVRFFDGTDNPHTARCYQLRVEPEVGDSFEASVTIESCDLELEVDDRTWVVYDPADTGSVRFDIVRINAELLSDFKESLSGSEQTQYLNKLDLLRQQGALSEKDYQAARAKFLSS